MTWQPIETAPKDAKRILLFWPAHFGGRPRQEFGHWQVDQYAKRPKPYWTGDSERLFGISTYRQSVPTHWQPELPLPATSGCPLGCTATSNCKAIRDGCGSECVAHPFQLQHGDAA